jgi:hypothetical protein
MGIESRKFNTSLTSQGKRVSSRGEKTSIDKKRNENVVIENTRLGSKNSTVHDSFYDRAESSEAHITNIEKSSQNDVNNETKTNSETVEPLAIFTFDNSQVENMSASVYQAYFEDQVSHEFSHQLIMTLEEKQTDQFKKLKTDIEKEIKDAEDILDLITEIDLLRDSFDNSLNFINKDTISSFAKSNYESLNPDTLRYSEEFFGSFDPATVLKKMTTNHNVIDEKTNTSLATQLLQFASYSLKLGISPGICKQKVVVPSGKDTVSSALFQGKLS